MKSIEWIEMLIAEKKLPSHRQAALLLGMSEPLMSQHRNGKALTLDDKYAYRLEELLGLPHGKIVADQHAERAADPGIAAMWRKLASTAAAILVLAFCGLSYAPKSLADIRKAENNNVEEYTLYAIKVVPGVTKTPQD